MKYLRLGMYALPSEDERLIRSMMRMFAHDPTFRWQLTDGPEFEVLVTDIDKMQDTKIKRSARSVLRLSSSPVPDDDHAMMRPLQASVFRNWLINAEFALTRSSTLSQRDSLSPASSADVSSSEVKTLRFKLRSWPPAIMMHGDPAREQMAQLLSVDAFEITELAQITGTPINDCQSFVRKLQLVGLLDLVSSDRDTGPATLPMEDDFSLAAIKEGLGARIGRLRDRFGL